MTTSKKKVIIMGGGVAGMSAAHELIERNFDVEVYERHKHYVGGKARSTNVPNFESPNPLPGEHGFRFFPGFYKHITDTMGRIPYKSPDGGSSAKTVLDNLVYTTEVRLALYDKPSYFGMVNFPGSFKELRLAIKLLRDRESTGLTSEEKKFFLKKMLQLAGSCMERRHEEYERISWWDYTQAERFSDNYRKLLVIGLSRTLVASRAETASTKTGGNTILQLVYNMITPDKHTDRILNGPTNDRWLNPWLDYLTKKGVKYHNNCEVIELVMPEIKVGDPSVRKIEKAIIRDNIAGNTFEVEGDYYLLAVPVERAAELVTPRMVTADHSLSTLPLLAKSVSWMNGIQFYLNKEVFINNGHVIYLNSEWALTSISQSQFWQDYDLSKCGNGNVKGILSVDISDWIWTAYKGVYADNATSPDEVAHFVWEQLVKSLNVDGKIVLEPKMEDMVVEYHLDRDIKFKRDFKDEDTEPLLVNTVNSWELRPKAYTMIKNLMLASDYVRTSTDLATMEGANEAARRAVNAILSDSNSSAKYCEIWPLSEPWILAPMRWYDHKRFVTGLPYNPNLPWWLKLIMVPWVLICMIYTLFRALLLWIFGI